MSDYQAVLATLARLLGSSPRFQYDPKRCRWISTKSLTHLSDALDEGYLSEHEIDRGMIELRLTRLGRRQLSAYKNWKAREAMAG